MNKPFAGRRILVTAPADRASKLVTTLVQGGAKVLIAPTVRVVPLSEEKYTELDGVLKAATDDGSEENWVGQDHWVALPSRNSLDFLLWRCERLGLAPSQLVKLKVAGLREDVEVLAGHGITPVITAPDAREMGAELQTACLGGNLYVLGPCGKVALRDWVHWGDHAVMVEAYEETPQVSSYAVGLPELRLLQEEGSVDAVVISSEEEFEALINVVAEMLEGARPLLEPVERTPVAPPHATGAPGAQATQVSVGCTGLRFKACQGQVLWETPFTSLQCWPVVGSELRLVFNDGEGTVQRCLVEDAMLLAEEMQAGADAMAAESGKRMVEELMGLPPTVPRPQSHSAEQRALALLSRIHITYVGSNTLPAHINNYDLQVTVVQNVHDMYKSFCTHFSGA